MSVIALSSSDLVTLIVTSIVNNGLPIAVDNVYPLQEYEVALSRLERGEQLGKIVLDHGITA